MHARNLLSENQDRTLDTAAAAALAAHLRGCGECAGADASLLAMRSLLRGLPPDPAPPELFARVVAAVEAEDRKLRRGPASGAAKSTRPAPSRLRVPLEAAAVILLLASVYWYQRTSPPAARPPSGLSSGISSEAGDASSSRPPGPKENTAKGSPPGIRVAHRERKTAGEAGPSAPKPRAWTAESLPSVPVYLAGTDSERIVPVAPYPLPTADPAAAQGPTYVRDIPLDVAPERREGAEERIVEATMRSGGIVERIERGDAGKSTVRVILPEAAAVGFLDELRRIGTVPPENMPAAIDIPQGPRPGTVACAVRIRVR